MSYSNSLEYFKKITQFTSLFLSNYFSDLKTEIDTSFALEKYQTQSLKQSWVRLIAYVEVYEKECLNSCRKKSTEISSPDELIKSLENENIMLLNDMIHQAESRIFQNKTLMFLTELNCVVEIFDKIDIPCKLICVKNQHFNTEDLELLKNNQVANGLLTNKVLKIKELISQLESNVTSNIIDEISLITTNTTHVYFNRYILKDIDSNAFKNFSNLILINLSDNQIESIHTRVFLDLNILSIIDLSNNLIHHLEAQLFQGLNNLKKIYLGSNRLSKIDSNMFKGLHNLILIDLSNNLLQNLEINLLQDLINLEYIWLDENRIENLYSNIFDGLNKLQLIDLSKNNLTKLDKKIFNNLIKLTDLNLSKNKLNEIEVDMFSDLTQLAYLDLSSNELIIIDSDVFNGLNSLVVVNLHQNKLESTNRRSFHKLPIKW